MKLISTLIKTKIVPAMTAVMLFATYSYGQITAVCTNPTNTVYGLTSNGEIYEINSTTAATIKVIKNNTYSGNSPNSANGLGYNIFNNKFYYFKRNVTSSPQEFVSFNPATNTVNTLAASTCTDDIHTGCVNVSGTGYYTVDVQGTLHYYNIATNKWTFITSSIVDQNGNNVTNVIKNQSAGDMAIDGLGNMWLLTSSNTNYGLYKFPANLPTTAVAQVTVVCWINPTATTPTGNSFAGIAFKPNGQIVMATKNDNKLYLLQTSTTLTFIGNLTTSDVGNDLTACAFPAGILPVTWKSFDAKVQGSSTVALNWKIAVEFESKGYIVEHSANGRDWNEIAFVVAKNDGKSAEYSYAHTNNFNGRQFYRITQVDLDGKVGYSEIATVTLNNDKQNIAVWPNPANDEIRIEAINSTNSRYTTAQVFDLSGRMFMEVPLQGSTNTIKVSKLPTGTYLVKVHTDNGTSYSQKIVKQ